MPRKLLLTMLVLGCFAVVSGAATYSAFSSQTSSSGNSFSAGTVQLTDNDAGTAMLSLSNAQPAASDTSCILITYSGSLDSTVRLYGTVAGSLASYVTLTVTRGTDASPTFDSCASFSADGTNYIGASNGVIYQGNLSAFPTSYAAGLVDPTAGSPESWTTSETHAYRFVVTLQNDNAAQGQSASASFTWEARNS